MSQPGDALRRQVLAELAARPAVGSLRPPSVLGEQPLRPVPAEVAAVVARRAAAGLEPEGEWYPGRWLGWAVPPLAGAAAGLLGAAAAGVAVLACGVAGAVALLAAAA